MDSNDIDLVGEIWNNQLGIEEKAQILLDVLKDISVIDYSLGPTAPWSKLRRKTHWLIFEYLQEKKGSLLFVYSEIDKAA